jgi:hypothetical protein
MPRDTGEENSAFEIGTLCLRLPHPVGRQQAHHEQKHDPRTVSLTLAHQGPMTEGVQLPVSDPVGKRFTDRGAVGMETLKARQLRREVSAARWITVNRSSYPAW